MQRIFEVDVFSANVLYGFELIVVLPNRPDGDAKAVVEVRVKECDIGAVCLGGERVVAIVDSPVLE